MAESPTPPAGSARPLTILTSQRIYDGRIVSLDVETVRLPSGRSSIREIVRHPGAVALVVVDSEGRLLLVRQYRRAPDRALLEIPAGTRESGEDAEAWAAAASGQIEDAKTLAGLALYAAYLGSGTLPGN